MRTSTIPCSGFTTLVGLHRITTEFLGKVLCRIQKDATELMVLKTNFGVTVLENFYWGSVRHVGHFFRLVRPAGRTAGGESPLFQPDVGQEVATQQGRLGNKGSEGS